jgi:pilus assembly protein CpaB
MEAIMRRGRVFFILAFVLILGLVAVAVVWYLFLRAPRGPTTQATPTPKPVMVVYITQNLSRGTELKQEMLAQIPWQQGQIAQGMVMGDQMMEMVGKVVKYDLPAGIPLLDSMLLKEGEIIPTSGSPWALNIPPGMVAVSIPASRIANVSYALRPGDHVNVIVTMMFVDVDTDFQSILPNFTGVAISSGPPDPESNEQPPLTVGVTSLSQGGVIDPETGRPEPPSPLSPGIYGKVIIDPVLGQAVYVVPSEAQRPRIVSHMLLQDVVVLQVGNFPLPGQEAQAQGTATPTPQGQQQGEEQAVPVAPDVVTLIVRPQDAVTLNYIMAVQTKMAASLNLVLRAANDNSRENVLPVTLQFLLEQYQIPVPARLPYSLNPRIDDVRMPYTP